MRVKGEGRGEETRGVTRGEKRTRPRPRGGVGRERGMVK